MSEESPFKNLVYHQKKNLGANEAGEFGGIYKAPDGQLSMVKKETNHLKNISEFLGSRIFQTTSPDCGAIVSLIVPKKLSEKLDQAGGLQNDGSDVYVKSDFFKNYKDMYADMDDSPNTKASGLFRKDSRPLFMGTRELLNKTLSKAFETYNYQDFDKIAPTSLLIGDFDIHTGNIGVIREEGKLPRLVRIDFAGSLNKLEKEIHPNSASRHLPLMGPTNHYREFPDYLKNNDKFANSLITTSQIDLDKTIDNSFKELLKYYNNTVLANWAKMTMPKYFNNKTSKNITIEEIKNAFKETMKKRQESLKEYGIEIKLGLLAKDKKLDTEKAAELRKLVQEHPAYFEAIASGTKKLKIRTSENFIKKILSQDVTSLIKPIKNLVNLIKTDGAQIKTDKENIGVIIENLVNLGANPVEANQSGQKKLNVPATFINEENIGIIARNIENAAKISAKPDKLVVAPDFRTPVDSDNTTIPAKGIKKPGKIVIAEAFRTPVDKDTTATSAKDTKKTTEPVEKIVIAAAIETPQDANNNELDQIKLTIKSHVPPSKSENHHREAIMRMRKSAESRSTGKSV